MNEQEDKKEEEYVRCEYCGKKLTLGEAVYEKVWINGDGKLRPYCSSKHAAYSQMGAEG